MDPHLRPSSQAPPQRWAPWKASAYTAAAYAAIGWFALWLAGPPGYASPLYPSAGIALAAVLTWGYAAVPGVWLGAAAVNAGLSVVRGVDGAEMWLLPLLIGVGAALQAAVGAALVRRFVSKPVVLNSLRDVGVAGLMGGLLACTVSASVGTGALLSSGTLPTSQALANWLTWWLGDTLGVLIATPAVLTLIGQPQADWRGRRLTLGLPLLVALGLVGAAVLELERLDRQRLGLAFERDVDRLAAAAQARLDMPLYALQALHSAALARPGMSASTLREASRWWLAQPLPPQAVGFSERVMAAEVTAFEQRAQAQGLDGYRVFQRDSGAAFAADGEVLALRLIEPAGANLAALGVNTLSIPAARQAVLASRRTGQPAATAGFRLTQSGIDETGLVLYQALYEPTLNSAADEATRTAAFRAVVFVTVNAEALFTSLTKTDTADVDWCVVDSDPSVERRRLAGPIGCENLAGRQGDGLFATRALQLGGRSFELRLRSAAAAVPLPRSEGSLLASLAGLSAAALLGALLLAVTGHSRRTELAVLAGTADLRREMAERALAQSAQSESQARLRNILNHVPMGVVFLDADGRVLDCNPPLCRMLGKTEEALRGSTLLDHAQAGSEFATNAAQGSAWPPDNTAVQLRRSNGASLWVMVSSSELTSTAGGATATVGQRVGVVQDITERRRLQASERALDDAEAANRATGEFLSRMSHELRTPLNAMIGFAQLLGMDREPALVPHQMEWTQQIQRAGWHLLDLINETLDLARIESGAVKMALKPVALAPLVAAVRAMVGAAAQQRGLTVTQDLDDDAGAVMGDSTRLKQVLTNLLSNAVKYNRAGGSISISSRAYPAGSVSLAVADTGLGMTPEQQAALFQPYNRLGRESSGIEGTGIGLVISQRLADLMGGTLTVQSAAGAGTTVTLRLQAADTADAPLLPMATTTTAPYQQRSVHYIEDNATNVEVMRAVLLQRPQVDLTVSTMGLDGIDAVRRLRPDLVLLDMQLPDISGLELLRHMKNDDMLAAIPIIVVSADATAARIREALTLGALHYVTKPLDVARFLAVLDETLEGLDTRWGL